MPIILHPPSERDRAALPEQLAALGRSRRRVAVATGVFALIGVVLAATLLACTLDVWLQLGSLLRGVLLVATLAVGGIIAVAWIARPLRLRTDSLSVALELESRYPRLNDSLGSAVSFLDDDANPDERGTSRRLRIAAIRKAERLAERFNFKHIVPTGRYWIAFWLCIVAIIVAISAGSWDTRRTQTALTRFADPFGNHPWPSKTQIVILSPEELPARLPKGAGFELRFAVRGVIPDRATIALRIGGGPEFDANEGAGYPLSVGGDPKLPGAAVVVAHFDSSQFSGNFQFRIRANDADTDWQTVTVVPPPRLVPLDGRASPQVHIDPPQYTGQPATDLPDGTTIIEAPLGTTIALRAATDVRLSSATLSYLGDRSTIQNASAVAAVGHFHPLAAFIAQSLAEGIGADIPLTLSGDGNVMWVTFTPSMTGTYLLKMTDETGLLGSKPIEIRLIVDPQPTVSLLRPAAGRDPPMLVPEASLFVQVSAADKVYALRRSFLEYRVGRDGPIRVIPLADARITWTVLPGVVGPAVTVRPQPSRYDARFTLPVSAFLRDDGTPVRDGDTVYLRAAADDWDDVSVLKEPGRSGEFELRIASRESIEAFLQKELAAMRPDLLRLREQQHNARQKTDEVIPKADGTLSPADREKLLNAEQTQKQIRGKVADARDGVRAKADVLRELVRLNNLPRSNTTDRVEVVADVLDRLTDRDIAAIEPLLGEARQHSAQPPKSGQEKTVPNLLTRAGRHQKTVEDGLSNLIDILSQWDAGGIRGDARVLRDNVLREANAADRLQEKVPPGKSPDQLKPGERMELDKAAGKVDRLAEQANGLLARAAKLAAEKEKAAADARTVADAKEKEADDLKAKAGKLAPGSPERKAIETKADALKADAADLRDTAGMASDEATALRKAIDAAGGQALPDDLRKAADALRNNRQGEAAGLERSAAARLDRLANELTEKTDDSVPELAKPKLKRAADQLDEIAGQQDELRKKADAANRIGDPAKRAEELKKLTTDQQQLIDRTRDVVQRLTRERAEDAARDARAALDKMETARDDLDRGQNPSDAQKDAVTKLDDARDKLDVAAARAPQELSDEKRRKLADKVKALVEKQKAAVAEAVRIQEKILKDQRWDRALLTSYRDLEDRERVLAVEVLQLAEEDFADLPVFVRVLKDSAKAMEKTADRVKDRVLDSNDAIAAAAAFDADLEKLNDAKVRRPMDLATRRLEQLLDALKPDAPGKRPKSPPKKAGGDAPKMPPMANPAGNGDAVPPLAQLKTLRALQAELNQRTAEFSRLHPDKDKLTDEEREELKELEDAQREITALFEEVAKLFQKQEPPPESEKK